MRISGLFLFILLNAPLSAQWGISHFNPDRSWGDIQFTSEQVGYVVGNSTGNNAALILKTTDGGATWNESTLPTLTFVQRVCFLNNDTGYVVAGGVPIRMLRTTNGGASWANRTLDTCFAVTGMDLLDANTAIYMNNEGRLRRFTGGGTAFTYITNDLQDWGLVDATDAQTAYIAEQDHFLRTGDGGFTWTALPGGLPVPFQASAFAFSDTQHGFASTWNTSGPNLYRTDDSAATWTATGTQNAWVLAARGQSCLAANTDNGVITWTPDGGTTWVDDPAPAGFTYAQGGELTPGNAAYLINEGTVFKRSSNLGLGLSDRTEPSWTMAPNPTTDKVRINGSFNDRLRITIHDGAGRVVARAEGMGELDLTALAPGSYMVRIEAEGERGTRRLVKL
ncbi:MAG: T9SS type A sorting domain-containing protein [Flavobacteriales bacterium]|nr:T9SS type A sorting domain-containing protein [Flavobacteriales bacterium]